MQKPWPEPEEQGREVVQSRRKPTEVNVIGALRRPSEEYSCILSEADRRFGARSSFRMDS
jgi:hypothetical protein